MKLYYAPGACSLSDHIALHEAGIAFTHEKVDLKAKRTESGDDYTKINPKGYVPALTLDSGDTLTENVAILDWIAHQDSALKPDTPLAHSRMLEALAYITSEIHKGFKPFFAGADDETKRKAADTLGKRFAYFDETMQGDYLFGDKISAADIYLFVMLLWARKNELDVPPKLAALRDRIMDRPATQTAMRHEGLLSDD